MRGDAVQYRESFGSVESVKAASDVYAPVDGEVLEVNDVRDDPFHYIDHQTAGTRSRHNPSPYPSSPPTPRRMLSACTQDRSSFFFYRLFWVHAHSADWIMGRHEGLRRGRVLRLPKEILKSMFAPDTWGVRAGVYCCVLSWRSP